MTSAQRTWHRQGRRENDGRASWLIAIANALDGMNRAPAARLPQSSTSRNGTACVDAKDVFADGRTYLRIAKLVYPAVIEEVDEAKTKAKANYGYAKCRISMEKPLVGSAARLTNSSRRESPRR
jgi:hypothetical protein